MISLVDVGLYIGNFFALLPLASEFNPPQSDDAFISNSLRQGVQPFFRVRATCELKNISMATTRGESGELGQQVSWATALSRM